MYVLNTILMAFSILSAGDGLHQSADVTSGEIQAPVLAPGGSSGTQTEAPPRELAKTTDMADPFPATSQAADSSDASPVSAEDPIGAHVKCCAWFAGCTLIYGGCPSGTEEITCPCPALEME